MRRIIVATDGSKSADRAVDAGAALAKATGADLVLLTIGGSVTGAELRNLADTAGDLSETMQSAANKILDQAQKRAHRLGVRSVTLQTGWGDPGDAIIDMTKRLKGDLVIVGRRGQSRLASLFLGSVSQKLASFAPCAVMVVP
ncbi:MAG TPA: universal stress protein [Pseudolabrys sp.]|nr:universal stress protein [Pseudolabrys sp.]